ncbi:CDC48 family AAA ATPase [archaeon]|jgi:transitional endoplasmic reticulum ATPase|nr:CDC48 family AAA ATPase [archaeon]MBT4241907.1 CDC48 family AAA ATPase [archaeon]MBT4418454.1 CDC48 family AAA ATPase [archaeon]
MKKNEGVKLRVAEALQDDAYRGIARIDYDVMKKLGISRGDVITIKGGRETVAIADKAYPADVGEGVIRVDGIIRKNAKTGVSENIIVSKANIHEAKKVIIAPTQKGIRVQGDLKPSLLGRAVIKGDILVLGGVQRRRELMDEMGGDVNDLFGNLNEMFGGFGMGGGLQQIRFIVANTSPNHAVFISENTEVVLSHKPVEISDESLPEITYEDIGGLTDEVKKIREMVEVPLKHPEVFETLGIDPPKGVLLHGPPGTGKTLLAKAVAHESEANFILLNGPEIMSKFYGESEKKIRDIFEDADKNSPSIIFIDEIDAIAPKREETGGEVERRVVSQLLTMMDGLQSRGKVVVIGATNRPNAIDPALRRPGRFDRELEIRAPDKKGRLQILKIHSRGMPLTKCVDLDKLASVTHGFVGADISALTKEAAMIVLRRLLPKLDLKDNEEIPEEFLKQLIVCHEDFKEALKVVRPSAMREVLVETPNVGWDDVGGLEKIKQELIEAVEWPLKYPDSFTNLGIRPPKGILLYGPPGTGKTLLAKAVAKESEANFIQVKGPSLLSMWVGKSEEGVRKIFERARQVSPCIIFFDEIDSLAGKRGLEHGQKVTERVLNQILSEMDGIEDLSNVIVIGATNRPDMLDSALLRPGRFDRILLASAPSEAGRKKIFEIHTEKMPLAKNVNVKSIINRTEGYVGADIESMVREAAMLALRDNINAKEVGMKYFEEAMKKVGASVSKSDIDRYRKIETDYLRSAKAALEAPSAYLG